MKKKRFFFTTKFPTNSLRYSKHFSLVLFLACSAERRTRRCDEFPHPLPCLTFPRARQMTGRESVRRTVPRNKSASNERKNGFDRPFIGSDEIITRFTFNGTCRNKSQLSRGLVLTFYTEYDSPNFLFGGAPTGAQTQLGEIQVQHD